MLTHQRDENANAFLLGAPYSHDKHHLAKTYVYCGKGTLSRLATEAATAGVAGRSWRTRTWVRLWVPNWSSTSCDLGVFVDQSAGPIVASDVKLGR